MGSILSKQQTSSDQQQSQADGVELGFSRHRDSKSDVPEQPLSRGELMKRAMAVLSMEEKLETIVVTTYGRAMIIGPSAVGKTSLKHGLMNQTPPPPESTRLAKTRQVKYEWVSAMGGMTSYWETVSDDYEYDELARLLSQVHKLPLNPTLDSAIAAFLSRSLVPRPAVYFMAPFLTQASKVHQHTKKMTEVKEVVEAVKEEQFQKILSKAFALWDVKNQSEVVLPCKESNVDPEVLMYVWDCGGQAVYLEILPAFLTSRTMFILAFDASKELEENWMDVLNTNGRREEREQQNYSTIDLLVRWLASIHAHLARYDNYHSLSGYPRVLLIGTHADKLKSKSPDYARKIKETISQRCQDMAFSELILGIKLVDNTTAGKLDDEDPVYQEIRDEVHKFASRQLTHDTPISWVLFRKLLYQYRRELNKPILTLSEAKAVGTACRIKEDDVPVVLYFYHELGVVLYYGYIPSLKDTVICDPQWLISQFAKIFSLDGQEHLKNSNQWKLFQTQGILTSSLYEAVWQDSVPEPQALVDLMEHFLLAVPIVCNTRHRYQPEKVKEYFVPSVLKVYNPDTKIQSDTEYYQTATPLYLLFSTGYVVTGFFIRLIAVLAKNDHFEVLFRRGVHRNRIILEYGPPNVTRIDEVVITEHLSKIEVTVARCVPIKHENCFQKVCRNILKTILQSSKEVLQWLPSIYIDTAFLCQCSSSSEVPGQLESSHVLLSSDDDESSDHGPVKRHNSSPRPHMPQHYVTFTLNHKDDDYLRCDQFQFVHPTAEQKYWLKSSEGKSDDLTQKQLYAPPLGNIKLREIADQVGDCLPILARRLKMESELEDVLRDSNVIHTAYSFMQRWNSLSGDVESLSNSLHELGLTKLANEIKPPGAFLMRPDRFLLPVSTEKLRGPEVLYISNNIDSRKMEALAAKLDMLETYHDIVRDVTVHNKKLCFLNKWCHMMDSREDLSDAVHNIGLTKLSARIRCGDFIDKATGEVDRTPFSPTPNTFSRKTSQEGMYQPTPSLADITECSRFLAGGDLHLLAYALDIGDEEYEELQKKYKHPSGVGLYLLKKWRRDVQGTKEELRQQLISVQCLSAAERLLQNRAQFS